jgi:hypothetical protein
MERNYRVYFRLPARRDATGQHRHCDPGREKATGEKSENQPRRNEEREDFFLSFLRPLHFFVVGSHRFWASQRDMKAPVKLK